LIFCGREEERGGRTGPVSGHQLRKESGPSRRMKKTVGTAGKGHRNAEKSKIAPRRDRKGGAGYALRVGFSPKWGGKKSPCIGDQGHKREKRGTKGKHT